MKSASVTLGVGQESLTLIACGPVASNDRVAGIMDCGGDALAPFSAMTHGCQSSILAANAKAQVAHQRLPYRTRTLLTYVHPSPHPRLHSKRHILAIVLLIAAHVYILLDPVLTARRLSVFHTGRCPHACARLGLTSCKNGV